MQSHREAGFSILEVLIAAALASMAIILVTSSHALISRAVRQTGILARSFDEGFSITGYSAEALTSVATVKAAFRGSPAGFEVAIWAPAPIGGLSPMRLTFTATRSEVSGEPSAWIAWAPLRDIGPGAGRRSWRDGPVAFRYAVSGGRWLDEWHEDHPPALVAMMYVDRAPVILPVRMTAQLCAGRQARRACDEAVQ